MNKSEKNARAFWAMLRIIMISVGAFIGVIFGALLREPLSGCIDQIALYYTTHETRWVEDRTELYYNTRYTLKNGFTVFFVFFCAYRMENAFQLLLMLRKYKLKFKLIFFKRASEFTMHDNFSADAIWGIFYSLSQVLMPLSIGTILGALAFAFTHSEQQHAWFSWFAALCAFSAGCSLGTDLNYMLFYCYRIEENIEDASFINHALSFKEVREILNASDEQRIEREILQNLK